MAILDRLYCSCFLCSDRYDNSLKIFMSQGSVITKFAERAHEFLKAMPLKQMQFFNAHTHSSTQTNKNMLSAFKNEMVLLSIQNTCFLSSAR